MQYSDLAPYYSELEEYKAQVSRYIDSSGDSSCEDVSESYTQTFSPVVNVSTQTEKLEDSSLPSATYLNLSLQVDQLKLQLQIAESDAHEMKVRLSERLFQSVKRFQESIANNVLNELHATFMHAEVNQLSAEITNIISPSPFQPIKRSSLLDDLRAFRERLFPFRE
jgi:hypothetical protein